MCKYAPCEEREVTLLTKCSSADAMFVLVESSLMTQRRTYRRGKAAFSMEFVGNVVFSLLEVNVYKKGNLFCYIF